MGLGSGIRDLGLKKAPDPGSGSATLQGSSKEKKLKVNKNIPVIVCFKSPCPLCDSIKQNYGIKINVK
jgi:hypothetical protein